ncbi:MAG: BACON domain-containing protein [Tidjanibacter sp.]|nr:BACON domain-containing protein [Tidjanibacter sp.]
MKFSFRKLLAFVLPLAMVMVSCNDDDPTYSNPYLTVGNRNISFTKDGGSVTFDIDANRSWTITASDTWLVASPASDDNKTGAEKRTTVNVTATANEGGPRSAQLTISSPAMTDPIIINVAQEGEGATPISEVVAADADGMFTVNATVVGVTEKSFVISDNSGSMLVYKADDPGVEIGDIVKVKGTTSSYNNLIQFAKDNLVIEKTGHNADFTQPTPEEMDGAAFTEYASNPSVKYVTLSAKYTLSENNGKTYHNFSVTGSGNRGSFQDVPASMLEGIESGDAVIATGYMIGAYNTNNYMVLVEIKADEGYVEPDATAATVADVLAGENGTNFEIAGTVGAVTKKSFILVDATGALNIYVNGTPKVGDAELEVGDNVTVEGTRGEYQNAVQLNSPKVTAREGEAVALPTAEEYDAAKLDAYIATPTTKLVKIAGTYSVSGTYYNLNIDGLNEAKGGSFYQTPAAIVGDIVSGTPVIVEGYLVGYNNGKYVNIHAVTMEVDSTPYLSVSKTEYEIAAAGGDVEIAINTNVAAFTAAVAGIEGAEAVVGEGKVTVTVPANTAEEGRTATVTISAEGVEDVTVTIKQEGAVTYTYAIMTEAPADYSGTYLMGANVTEATDKTAAGWYALTGINSNNGVSEVITVTDGVLTATSSLVEGSTVTIAKVDGEDTYTVKLGELYLHWTKENKLYGSETLPESNYKWTISGAGENGVEMKLADVDDTGKYDHHRYLLFNSTASSKHFRCYRKTDGNTGTWVDADQTWAAAYYLMTLFKEVTE